MEERDLPEDPTRWRGWEAIPPATGLTRARAAWLRAVEAVERVSRPLSTVLVTLGLALTLAGLTVPFLGGAARYALVVLVFAGWLAALAGRRALTVLVAVAAVLDVAWLLGAG